MAKVPGCWANSLDNCVGKLSREHYIPVAVWEVPEGGRNDRATRLQRPLRFSRYEDGKLREARDLTVQNLASHMLCRHHNGATSDLDTEAGKFAAAVRDFFDTHKAREQLVALNWNPRTFLISGPLIERWLLKLAINNVFDGPLPIGAASAPVGRPTSELVEMVFGVRAVPRENGTGLFRVESDHNEGDQYSLNYIESNGTHVSAFLLSIGMFHLGVNLETKPLSPRVIASMPQHKNGRVVPASAPWATRQTNVELRLAW